MFIYFFICLVYLLLLSLFSNPSNHQIGHSPTRLIVFGPAECAERLSNRDGICYFDDDGAIT